MNSYRISNETLYVSGNELTAEQMQQIAGVMKALKIKKLKIVTNYPVEEPTYR